MCWQGWTFLTLTQPPRWRLASSKQIGQYVFVVDVVFAAVRGSVLFSRKFAPHVRMGTGSWAILRVEITAGCDWKMMVRFDAFCCGYAQGYRRCINEERRPPRKILVSDESEDSLETHGCYKGDCLL